MRVFGTKLKLVVAYLESLLKVLRTLGIAPDFYPPARVPCGVSTQQSEKAAGGHGPWPMPMAYCYCVLALSVRLARGHGHAPPATRPCIPGAKPPTARGRGCVSL